MLFLFYSTSISDLLGLAVVVAGFAMLVAFLKSRRDGSLKDQIRKAEQERVACPNIQDGKFTRLYTMPYYETLTPEVMAEYIHAHYPDYRTNVSGNELVVTLPRSFLSREKRILTIHHLQPDRISAIEVVDPNEVQIEGRYRANMRSTIDDRGLADAIRKASVYFQQQAVLQNSSGKLK